MTGPSLAIDALAVLRELIAGGMSREEAGAVVNRMGNVVNATHEQVPGIGTSKFADAIVGSSEGTRQGYSRATNWQNAIGHDKLFTAAGLNTAPTATGSGTFRLNDASPLEVNPLQVGKADMTGQTILGRNGQLKLSNEDVRLLNKLEAVRALGDGQNAGAWNMVSPGGGSLYAPGAGNTTPTQMLALHGALDPMGYSPVDNGNGLAMMNFSGQPQSAAMGDSPAVTSLIQAIKPGAARAVPVGFGPGTSSEIKFGREMASGNAGRNSATSRLADMLTSGKTAATKQGDRSLIKALDDPAAGVRDKIQANLDRDQQFASPGYTQRADITRMRKIWVNEGLAGLVKAVRAGTFALPAVAAFLSSPDASQTSQPDDTE